MRNKILRCKYNLSLPFKDKLAFSPRSLMFSIMEFYNSRVLGGCVSDIKYFGEMEGLKGRTCNWSRTPLNLTLKDPNILCLMIHFEKDELRNQGDPNKEEGAFSNLEKQIKDTETYCLVAKDPEDIALNDSIPEEVKISVWPMGSHKLFSAYFYGLQSFSESSSLSIIHQCTVSKSHSAPMTNLNEKIEELKGILDELKTDLARVKKGKSLLKGADGKPKKNLNPEAGLMVTRYQKLHWLNVKGENEKEVKKIALCINQSNVCYEIGIERYCASNREKSHTSRQIV
ncbi:hypothetical protein RHGRI_026558 [Rhododendron griersonianum]|uniref:Uncharacterized protein n=1 Tax=Rhododendron griersonianum TaxID=479676 RepID=A0AAV6ITA9_9ERIC|nr:hypothetical protein RHGRI_026558 [Rhododendron griersonianum]